MASKKRSKKAPVALTTEQRFGYVGNITKVGQVGGASPLDALAAFVQRLSDLKGSLDPAATLVITREQANVLGWELMCALIHAGARDTVATDYEERDARSWEALAESGREAERLGLGAREQGWLDPKGRLLVGKDGRVRFHRVMTYVAALHETGSAEQAAQRTEEALGYKKRNALRSALRRDRKEIAAEPEAPERSYFRRMAARAPCSCEGAKPTRDPAAAGWRCVSCGASWPVHDYTDFVLPKG